ncbi:MAG TPA: lytic transglycosylase domain-containing protein [Candidatus Acidoferrum sp.]|jgi:soluble lytic murein transglycosylase-like protein
MNHRPPLTACICAIALAFCALPSHAQITKVVDNSGRQFFVNAEPSIQIKLASRSIFLPSQTSFAGANRPAVNIDRDGAEKLVSEAAERHRVDPRLVRAVIQTESGWNPGAISRKGAVGLMQLIPTTAQRFGVNDVLNPQQNVDAGVRYLKVLLERYNGNLDLALAAYNAGEGAVDRAHGVPAYRETRDYVHKVQNAYNGSGAGRASDAWFNPRAIHKNVEPTGRIVFTNE